MALWPFSWDGIQCSSMTTFSPKRPNGQSVQTKAKSKMASHSRTRRRQPSRLWALAALLSTASAVSLNDLQPIANGVLPTMCNMAYNTPFAGCTTADFASGTRCSQTCRDGIKTVEQVVDMVCDDVTATRDTVLDFAQRGVLLLHTCDGNGNDITLALTTSTPPTTSIQVPPTSTLAPPTSISVAPTISTIPIVFTPPALSSTSRSIGSFTIIPTPEPPPVSSTLVVPPIQSTTTAAASLTIIPPLPTLSSTTQLLTSTSEARTSSQVVTSSFSTFTQTTTTASAAPSSQGDGQGRGGGSPFDSQVSLSSKLCTNWPLCLTVGAMVLGVMFR